MSDWFPIRPRVVKKLLLALREDQATGPDGFAAIFLKKLAEVISVPLAILTRRMFNEATWPTDWKIHHIAPLFRKGSRFLPGQYRGIHLRIFYPRLLRESLGNLLLPFWKHVATEMRNGLSGRNLVLVI